MTSGVLTYGMSPKGPTVGVKGYYVNKGDPINSGGVCKTRQA